MYHHRFRDADYRSFRRARNCPELILGVWSECCNASHQVSLRMPVLRTIWIFFVAILITILITINIVTTTTIVSVIVIVTTEGNADFCHFTFSTQPELVRSSWRFEFESEYVEVRPGRALKSSKIILLQFHIPLPHNTVPKWETI